MGHDIRSRLRAAALLGLVSSTFSTLVASMGGGRIGRDVGTDWMVVASLVLRDGAWKSQPDWPVMLPGILVHQAADFGWVIVFFVLLGRWTSRLSPGTILLLAGPWALLTSALEWLLLVPLLPFWQPVFTLEQSYWIGLTVHWISSSLYPLFPALRNALDKARPSPHRRFATIWASLATVGLLLIGLATWFGNQNREMPHLGVDAEWDRGYMRRMVAHHEQGVQIAKLAEARTADPHLRGLARLMIAAQNGEVRALTRWWRSWFPDPPASVCSARERQNMPGMLDAARLNELSLLDGTAFDAAFIDAMSFHHRGAIAMADEAMHRATDPRLSLMSQAIVHGQRGEIALMHGVRGPMAVSLAVRSMIAPFGAHLADRPGARWEP